MSTSRHQQLIRAGWRYDAGQDRYAAPGSPTDGTERWYNQAAAWQAQQAAVTDKPAPDDPRARHTDDDRRQEPQ